MSKRDKKKKGNIFKRMNSVLKLLSFKELNKTIKGYGYSYSMKSYLGTMFVTLAALIGISIFYGLRLRYILIIVAAAILCMPIIILAQFRYTANNDKFEQVVNYMDHMIINFKRTPKILTAMEGTVDMTEGKMRRCLEEAISIIKYDAKSTDVYKKAFALIENEFRTSRIRTLHRFLLNVEQENSQRYQESIDTLHFDIRSWVTRTYKFQASLKSTKARIMIIIGLSVVVGALFANVYSTAEESLAGSETTAGFTIIGNSVYQVATVVYFVGFIILYTIINSRLNGFWVADDLSSKSDAYIQQYMYYVDTFDHEKAAKQSIVAALIGIPVLVVGAIIGNKIVIVLGVFLILALFLKTKMSLGSKKKAIEREIKKEFPVWLRDIAINLHNMVALNAIQTSVKNAAPIMKPFIYRFLKAVELDPVTIRPYANFLGKYDVAEISTAVKMLYAIRTLSAEDSQRQINDLITRNQALLEDAEKMKHEDAIAGISFISAIPMVMMALYLIVTLAVMFMGFMGLMSA